MIYRTVKEKKRVTDRLQGWTEYKKSGWGLFRHCFASPGILVMISLATELLWMRSITDANVNPKTGSSSPDPTL